MAFFVVGKVSDLKLDSESLVCFFIYYHLAHEIYFKDCPAKSVKNRAKNIIYELKLVR
ncbi:MAG: hypothetical protein ABIT07_12210 [Ferruginibacter sp.]